MRQVILPQNLLDRHGRRVLTDAGMPGREGKEGVGSTTEQHQGHVAAAINAHCEHLDDAQLDEIVAWVRLYKAR